VESHPSKKKGAPPGHPNVVILSAAGTSRSEVPAEPKDPYTFHRAVSVSGNSPRALDFAEGHPRNSERQTAMLNLIFGRVARPIAKRRAGIFRRSPSGKPAITISSSASKEWSEQKRIGEAALYSPQSSKSVDWWSAQRTGSCRADTPVRCL
jgi:hypothetical protein